MSERTDSCTEIRSRIPLFVGRDLELNDVVKRLHDNRLLTLTGVGGSG